MTTILTVSDLTRGLKEIVEAEFPMVWVRGEVANLARPASGHVYFTLTDGQASLNVVWFKNAQPKPGQDGVHPLTGEVMEPGAVTTAHTIMDGAEVLAAGRLTVYGPRSVYQLSAELVQAQGSGDLSLAFEALKRDLAARGWFDESRKKPLPNNPARVALITSTKGAAVRDFLRIAESRGTGAEIRIYPTLVQGSEAPAQIAAALKQVAEQGWAQVAAMVRGGGSMEDLWAFNTEEVAKAMVDCPLPIITGVGHEPDITIADYVADCRAATPTHAAQELWPRRSMLMQRVDEAQMDLMRAFEVWLTRRADRLAELQRGLAWLSPVRRLDRARAELGGLIERLSRAMERTHAGREHECSQLAARLAPAGQRLRQRPAHELSGLVEGLSRAGQRLHEAPADQLAQLVDRLARSLDQRSLNARGERVRHLIDRLSRTAAALHLSRAARLDGLSLRLESLNPEAPLARGYSLVRLERTGRFLRSAREVRPGDSLDITTGRGRVAARVADEQADEQVDGQVDEQGGKA